MKRTSLAGVVILASACGSSTASSKPTAADVVAKIKSAGIPVISVYVETAEKDPNHLLGRPNGYSSKEVVTDSRVPAKSRGEVGSVDQGASIEVFGSNSEAADRKNYIQAIARRASFLANEYDYVRGVVLIRVSGLLTPVQAADYKKVVDALPG